MIVKEAPLLATILCLLLGRLATPIESVVEAILSSWWSILLLVVFGQRDVDGAVRNGCVLSKAESIAGAVSIECTSIAQAFP